MSAALVSRPAAIGGTGPEAGEHYVDVRAVAARLSVSVATVYRMVQRGQLPAPRKTGIGGSGRSRWLLSECVAAFERAQGGIR